MSVVLVHLKGGEKKEKKKKRTSVTDDDAAMTKIIKHVNAVLLSLCSTNEVDIFCRIFGNVENSSDITRTMENVRMPLPRLNVNTNNKFLEKKKKNFPITRSYYYHHHHHYSSCLTCFERL